MKFFTIGVFNSTESEFFKKLADNKIDTFCDIRQRRSVRGAEYKFVNSVRLQKRLAELGIQYEYIFDLAPTTAIRELQKAFDEEQHITQRHRERLSPKFIEKYKHDVLSHFDFKSFTDHLKNINAKHIVLFCVEEHAEACHRSVVADQLKKQCEADITHL